jgi:starch synthase
MVPALLKIQYAHLPFLRQRQEHLHHPQPAVPGHLRIKEVQDVLGLGDGLWSATSWNATGAPTS